MLIEAIGPVLTAFCSPSKQHRSDGLGRSREQIDRNRAFASNRPVANYFVAGSVRAAATIAAVWCLMAFRGLVATQPTLTNPAPFDHLVVLNPAVSPKETYVGVIPIGSHGVSRGFMFG